MTGRARFGADFSLPGQLIGKVLRSPHAHAEIKSIDTSKALALNGVKAVITAEDFPDQPNLIVPTGEMQVNMRDITRNIMAREKALYEGHPVAAVAAVSEAIAKQALALIKVDYKVLPHVIDVAEAMKPGAPILHDHLLTEGANPPATKPSNIAKRIEFKKGDAKAGFDEADVVIEKDYTTQAVHQGYIEPHATLASAAEDGQVQVWSTTQGHFQVRGFCSRLLGLDTSQIRVTPTEIGGGFGGKTVVYLEPLAIRLSQKSGKPVKMTMAREDVFRASGPAPGGNVKVKIGAKKDGRIVAAECIVEMQAGAFPGSPVGPACMCSFACYDIDNVYIEGFDVVSNRPKVAAYRAPGAPISAWAVESTLDILAQQLKMDPIDLRLKNAAKAGTKTAYGVTFNTIGMVETLQAIKDSEHYRTPVKPGYGRGVAAGFWFNIGADSSAASHVGEDGSVTVISGNPDIGGSRASLALMAAEELGVDYSRVRPVIADTASIGFNFVTGGSRVTFATGLAVVNSVRDMIRELKVRAAKIWKVDPDARDLGERHGQARRRQRRHLRAAHPRRSRRPGGADRRADQRPCPAQRHGRRAGLRRALRRPQGRRGHRLRHRRPLHRGAGCRHGDPSLLRRGPAPGRRRAGRRLGAERGVHLQRQGQARESRLPRLSHAGRLRPADDRDHPGRGAQSAASLRRARRRRGADRAAHRRRRQRHRPRHRRAHGRPADVAAAPQRSARRGAARRG